LSTATSEAEAFWAVAAVAERRHVGERVREILAVIQGHEALNPWERGFADSISVICRKAGWQPSLSDKQLALLLRLHDLVTGQFTFADSAGAETHTAAE
jgi:hypothetical protein